MGCLSVTGGLAEPQVIGLNVGIIGWTSLSCAMQEVRVDDHKDPFWPWNLLICIFMMDSILNPSAWDDEMIKLRLSDCDIDRRLISNEKQ